MTLNYRGYQYELNAASTPVVAIAKPGVYRGQAVVLSSGKAIQSPGYVLTYRGSAYNA